jgi:hypothetical protein
MNVRTRLTFSRSSSAYEQANSSFLQRATASGKILLTPVVPPEEAVYRQ